MCLLRRLDPDHVRDRADHAADRRGVIEDDRLVKPRQAEPADRVLVPLRAVRAAPRERDFEFQSHDYALSSSRDLPRRRAVSSAERSIFSASIVAWMTLCGFEVPMHFVRMSATPATSRSG